MTDLLDIAEALGPTVLERALLERDIQNPCVSWARDRGYWARKFSSMSQRSVPDYLFSKFHEGKRLKFCVEFKRPGETSTKRQQDEQAAMIAAGWLFFECDNVEKFKAEVLRLEAACCTTEC